MEKRWYSGWRKWNEGHQDASQDEIMKEFQMCEQQFSYKLFIEHYDSLSVDEWQDVIEEARNQGFDIRCVLYYKQECDELGEDFSISVIDEVLNSLLRMDGAISFCPIPHDCVIEYPDELKTDLIEQYQQWNLPIPKYWRERLWL